MADLIKEYSVSQIVKNIQTILEKEFFYIKIKGEISGLKKHTSGHYYFSLKDEKSMINAVMFKQYTEYCNIDLVDGLEVVACGKLTIYKERSNYQILVETIAVSGEGTLLKLIQERKEKLAKEGLFDTERKKPIPKYPKSMGLITAETGAALQDILSRLENRTPIKIYLYSSLMQGKDAPNEIIQGIKYFNNLDERPDVLVISRGGGSIEDLMAFNDEDLVREVANSKIPTISAVGHEIDWTLIDYASDLRLPTPTSVAEYLTISKEQAFERLNYLVEKLIKNKFSKILEQQEKLDNIFTNYLKKRFIKYKNNYFKVKFYKAKFYNIFQLLASTYLNKESKLKNININKIIKEKLAKLDNKIKIINLKLENYINKYPILKDNEDNVIKLKAQIDSEKEYILKFIDGEVKVKIIDESEQIEK